MSKLSSTMETYGATLLNDVEVCDLREILLDARVHSNNPSEASTGICFIDQLAAEKSKYTTTASRKQRYPVIELISAGPAAGKTHLIYYAIASAMLRCSFAPPYISANLDPYKPMNKIKKGGCAIVLDTDSRFSIPRLAQVMRNYVLESSHSRGDRGNGPITEFNADSIVSQALDQVYVFSPQSMQKVVSTVREIPMYLDPNGPNAHSRDRTLDLVIVDSLSAFFWQTAYSTESLDAEESTQTATAGQTTSIEPSKGNQSLYGDLVDSFKELQERYACAVIAANCSFSPPSSSLERVAHSAIDMPLLRTLLPPVWTSFCTLRLGVAREAVTRFPHGMSLGKLTHDRPARLKVVKQGKFHSWIESEPRELRTHSFTFRITSQGVSVGS